MGISRGQCCYEHHDRGVSVEVLPRTDAFGITSSGSGNFREDSKSSSRLHTKVAKSGNYSGDYYSHSSLFFPSVHASQEKREITSHNRSVIFKPSSKYSLFQDGDSGRNLQVTLERSLGLLCGHRRCLLSRPYGLGLSQIPCLQTQGQDLCVSVPPIWSESGTLGVHTGNKANQETASSSTYPNLLFPGRFHPVRPLSLSFERCNRQDFGPFAKPGFQDQLGKIQPSASTGSGVFGRILGLEGLLAVSSSGQARNGQSPVFGNVPAVYRHQERIGKSDWFTQLRGHLRGARKTPSSAFIDVDESAHQTRFQGRVCFSRREVQRIVEDLDVSRLFGSSCPYAPFSTFSYHDDRRFFGRLVWDSATSQGSWFLGSRRVSLLNELEGVESNSSVACGVPEAVVGADGEIAVRQYNGHFLPEESGFGKGGSSTQPHHGDSGILQAAVDCFTPRTPQGRAQCSGGPRFSTPSSSYGVVSGRGDICMDCQSGTPFSSGSIRHLGKCTASPVCVPLPGRFGSGGQRFQLRLESLDIHLPLPSNELPDGRGVSPPRVQRVGHPDSSLLAVEGVVSSPPSTMSPGSCSPSERIHSESDDIEGVGVSRRSSILEPSRLDSVSKPWEGLLSEDSVNILRNNHREGTVRQYQSIWSKFLEFLSVNHISHQDVSVFVVMNFLSHHFVAFNRKYRTIAAYKCALAHPLFVNFGIDFKDVRLEMYMKGVFNSNPPVASAPMPVWSLNDLLAFLVSEQFEPLSSKALYTVTQKTLCLLLLASGRRIGEIAHLSKKHTYRQDGNVVTFHWLPQFFPKHCDSSFQPKLPSIERLDSDCIQDLWLCPVRALNTYLGMIGGGPRFSINSPLWSYDVKGLTKMFQTTVFQARQHGGDVAIVPMGPHQVRKLAASYSAQMVESSSASELKLMERMGCSSMSVLRRVYVKDVPCLNFKCVLPVGTFVPTIE